MFGRRSALDVLDGELLERPLPAATKAPKSPPATKPVQLVKPKLQEAARADAPYNARKSAVYYSLKREIFGVLIDVIDVSQLTKMDTEQARHEIGDVIETSSAPKAIGTLVKLVE